ncbi:rhombosortase [Aliiglaciecola lipolytica]|uniref:Peptidase S54 rhomboid domain-containing protein n=1 Tax=Aliiglaciecola lipolytica E3 TaxID=1127673 RepID=K6YUC1_9ALTE|nr:rhombosortase [Aliiglaciecola lipolytica]GAC14875.1 hypothetical protein GLIP_2247 [Aliiglaciecola lipolytica E3]
MLKFPIKNQQFVGPICIAVICIVLWIIEPLSSEYLALVRSELPRTHWWQFITANFVHTNTNHLLLNLAGVLLLWVVHGEYYKISNYLFNSLVLSFWVTFGIYIFSPTLSWYAGLSGVLHGLFVYGACKDIQHKIKFGWLLFVGIWVKIGYEQLFGADQMISDLIAANVAVDAHLYGALGGLSLVLMRIRLKQG